MNFKSIGNIKLGNITTYDTKKSTTNMFKSTDYSVLEEIDYKKYDEINYDNLIELESSMISSINENEWYEVVAATGCVALTSVVSGVVKIAEGASDGLTWLGGMAVSGVARLFGNKEFANNIEDMVMDEIARDIVGEMNEKFYKNTELGRTVNDASTLKYNSELAQGIQNVTTEIAIIAGATAATVITGGAAVPLFVGGFLVGAGQSAESNYQDIENRDFWEDSIEIGVDGTIKGLSTVAYGRAGAAAFNGVKSVVDNGIKNTFKETLHAFNKDAIKSTIKNNGKKILRTTAISTANDSDTLSETGTVLLDDAKLWLQTGELNIAQMICDVALIYGGNYIGNLAGGILSDSVKKIDRIVELYEEGQQAARIKYEVGFKSYREHAEKHVYYVADYMKKISADVDDINLDETLFASLAHDLGMKGGYVKYNGKYVLADSVLSEISKPSFNDINKFVRKPHPLNSALTVLTDDIIPDGIDRDVVALLAMSHSKSTSGITYFDNPQQWNSCVDELEAALKQYNFDNGTSFSLDTKKLKDMISDSDSFVRLQKEALIIRDGDAMSTVFTIDGNTYMQTDMVSEVVNHNLRTSFDDIVGSEKEELSGLTDILKNKDGSMLPEGIDSDVSSGVKYHVGELNVKFFSQTDGMDYYMGSVDLIDANQTPHSTMFAIKERIGEVNTYSNISNRQFTINLPKEAKGTSLGDWYESELAKHVELLVVGDGMGDVPLGIDAQLREGLISQETYDKQKAFYENLLENGIKWI